MGRFIVLGGGRRSGKSTQAALLAGHMGAVLTREPGGTAVGEALRRLLLDPSLPAPVARAETLMLLAARAQHVAEVIEPALARGADVVCDRYSGSTLAYQGYGRGLDLGRARGSSTIGPTGAAAGPGGPLGCACGVCARRSARRRRSRPHRRRGGTRSWRGSWTVFTSSRPVTRRGWRVVDGRGTVEQVAALVREAVC